MNTIITGRVWVYGDNVDTDVIIPARHLTMAEPAALAKHCMEDLDRSFAKEVRKGDIVVGGVNFGCGSSREHAPLAFIGCGVAAVVATNFARIFYRNAINVGLPIFECPDLAGNVEKGDTLTIDAAKGTVVNVRTRREYRTQAFPPFLAELIEAGGLVGYVEKRLADAHRG